MINVGSKPFTDVMPLPYSPEVIDSFKILLPALQTMIQHIITNKFECIARGIEGIIPKTDFSTSANLCTTEEKRKIEVALKNFYDSNLIHVFDTDFHLPSTFDVTKLKWYVNLDQNMEKWNQLKRSVENAEIKPSDSFVGKEKDSKKLSKINLSAN